MNKFLAIVNCKNCINGHIKLKVTREHLLSTLNENVTGPLKKAPHPIIYNSDQNDRSIIDNAVNQSFNNLTAVLHIIGSPTNATVIGTLSMSSGDVDCDFNTP